MVKVSREPMTDYERRMVQLTGVIAGVTGVYAFFALLQWYALRSTNNINVAASAPHISVRSASVPTKDGNEWLVFVPYKNSGQWVAHYVNPNIIAFQGKSPPPAPPCTDSANDTGLPVAYDEGYEWHIPIEPPPADKDIAAILNGSTGLYVLGCVTYRDALGNHGSSAVCESYDARIKAYGFCELRPGPLIRPAPQAQPNLAPED